jgi:hypothetical protein
MTVVAESSRPSTFQLPPHFAVALSSESSSIATAGLPATASPLRSPTVVAASKDCAIGVPILPNSVLVVLSVLDRTVVGIDRIKSTALDTFSRTAGVLPESFTMRRRQEMTTSPCYFQVGVKQVITNSGRVKAPRYSLRSDVSCLHPQITTILYDTIWPLRYYM